MTNNINAANPTTNQPEEPKYPEREITFERMNAKDRNSGTICYKFAQDFRHSCFYFTLDLNQQREKILIPPRSQLIQHISNCSPNYQYPSCLSNKDLRVEEKIKKTTGETSDTIKFQYKDTPITQEDDQHEEDQEDEDEDEDEKKHANTDSDQQEEDHEEDDDDRVGDYLMAQNDDGDDNDQDGDDDYGD